MADDGPRAYEHRPRLGRGLAALLGDSGDEQAVIERSRGVRKAPIELLRPNPRNPRKTFEEGELDELAASIRERGVIQPVLVRSGSTWVRGRRRICRIPIRRSVRTFMLTCGSAPN